MDALSVNQDEDVTVAEAVHLEVRTHVVLAEGERRRQAAKDLLYGATRVVAEHLRGDDLRLNRGVLEQMVGAGGRDYDLLNSVIYE